MSDSLLVVQILLMLVFGFIAGTRMKERGESGLLGFCLGFFLGLIGIWIAWRLTRTTDQELAGWTSRDAEELS